MKKADGCIGCVRSSRPNSTCSVVRLTHSRIGSMWSRWCCLGWKESPIISSIAMAPEVSSHVVAKRNAVADAPSLPVKRQTPEVDAPSHSVKKRKSEADSRTCLSCFNAECESLLAVPCGHVFCEPCITKRCSLALLDRSMVPAHCCGMEFPIEYVKTALGPNFCTYSRFLSERNWRATTLRSDVDYAATVESLGGKQCPHCGIGVQRIDGCDNMLCFCGKSFNYRSGYVSLR